AGGDAASDRRHVGRPRTRPVRENSSVRLFDDRELTVGATYMCVTNGFGPPVDHIGPSRRASLALVALLALATACRYQARRRGSGSAAPDGGGAVAGSGATGGTGGTPVANLTALSISPATATLMVTPG